MKKFLTLALALATMTLISCSKEDDPTPPGNTTPTTVKVTPEVVNAPATSGEYTLKVTNETGGWEAVASDVCKDWVTVKTANWTSKGGDVNVTVSENKTTNTRVGEVIIKAGTQRISVKVNQDAPMQLDRTEVYSNSSGESFTIGVKGAEWSCVTTDAWITAEKVDDKTLKITTAQNDSDADRTGTVEVKNATETLKVNVKQSSNIDRIINVPDGYHLVWHDEFNEGTELGSAWTHEVQGQGWVNNELQNYVNGQYGGQRVTEIKDGKLIITAFKASNGKVYSGRVYANQRTGYTYGYFEARFKLPKGKGTWPAYWMMPVKFTGWPGCGEIDIMEEVGVDANIVSSSIHCQAYNHPNNTQKTASKKIPTAQDEFHIYALEWTADAITTYVDGVQLFQFKNDKKGNHDTWPFDVPFYPIFNLAWGGDWGGYAGVDEKALPCTFEIDYIRIFQK